MMQPYVTYEIDAINKNNIITYNSIQPNITNTKLIRPNKTHYNQSNLIYRPSVLTRNHIQ